MIEDTEQAIYAGRCVLWGGARTSTLYRKW